MCDASWSAADRSAGYGYWIASERGKLGGGGPIMAAPADNNIAEMMAVANSIHAGIRSGLIQSGDRVLVQTDSLNAIKFFRHGPNDKQRGLQPFERLREIETRWSTVFGLKVMFRHVRGHSGRKEARFASNRHCDQRAHNGRMECKKRLANCTQ